MKELQVNYERYKCILSTLHSKINSLRNSLRFASHKVLQKVFNIIELFLQQSASLFMILKNNN